MTLYVENVLPFIIINYFPFALYSLNLCKSEMILLLLLFINNETLTWILGKSNANIGFWSNVLLLKMLNALVACSAELYISTRDPYS